MPPHDRTNLVFATVKCRNRVIEAIVDTGAEISIISPQMCKILSVNAIQKWDGPLLVMANGTQAHPEGSVSLEIFVGTTPVYASLAVLPINGFDLLLGNNALRQLQSVQIDYDQEGGSIFSSKVEPESPDENENDELGCIASRESRTIPAFSMVTVAVDVKKNKVDSFNSQMIIEPSNKVLMTKGFSVGRLLLPFEAIPNVMNVQLVNFSRSDQWLNEGTVLGKIGLVETVETLLDNEDQKVGPSVGLATAGESSFRFTERINKDLSPDDRKAVQELLSKYSDCFASCDSDLGRSNISSHRIDTGNQAPIHQPPYKSAWKERELIQSQVKDMLQNGVIEPSSSPWASPVVLVKKKEGTWRFCVDYRKLNAATTRDVYPLPRIEDALSRLEGSRYFSILDMQAGYWQVGLDDKDKEKTAFVTADGLYQFNVMPFGLSNAPATFQRMMDVLLAGLKWNTCLVYLDDIVIFSETISEHLARLEAVLLRFRKAGLKLKLPKCTFLATCLKVLGYVVSGLGLSPDPMKLSAVQNFPTPSFCLKNVQSFIGLCSYYRKFIRNFADLARPLTNLTKKNEAFRWTSEHQASFEALKQALLSPPILGHPNYNLPMEIHCDACSHGVGAVLVQRQEGVERVISYASRLMDKYEANYSVSEQECLALIFAVDRFKSYIWGMKIRVVTDHHALCWLMKKRNLAGRLARWSLQLQDLDIEIVHRSGRLHSDADALSRNPIDPPENVSEIPLLSIQTIQKENIQSEQEASSWWRSILIALREKNPSPRTRRLIRNFELREGVLFHRFISHGMAFYRLCVPRSLVKQVLLACHDDVTAGHLGVTRTVDKIRKRYFWPSMTRQIIHYVRTCVECQMKKRPVGKPVGMLQTIRSQQPFEKVGIDLIGPFPLSRLKNKHIIVAVDYFTKWVIAQPVPHAKTREVVDFFVRRVVLQHGAPSFLISDRGKCLTSKFANELYRALQTNHLVTAAYHPQCNGLVERFNHTFAEMLSMYVSSCHDDWDEVVDFVVFAYNTSRQESTGVSPFYLLYGREAILPVDVALGNNPVPVKCDEASSAQLRDLATRLANIREIVKRRLILVRARQKRRYDLHRKSVTYATDDLVWIYRPDRKKGRSEKLLHRYHGPYKIVQKISDLNYVITLVGGRRKNQLRVHVSSLKPCLQRHFVPCSGAPIAAVARKKTSVLQEIAALITTVSLPLSKPSGSVAKNRNKAVSQRKVKISTPTINRLTTERVTRSGRILCVARQSEGCGAANSIADQLVEPTPRRKAEKTVRREGGRGGAKLTRPRSRARRATHRL